MKNLFIKYSEKTKTRVEAKKERLRCFKDVQIKIETS